MKLYKTVENAIYGKNQNQSINNFYFVDAPGGTGKTFVFNALLARVRKGGDIALAVAASGIAALLLEGGRTAHSRFKISLDLNAISTCNINVNRECVS